MSPDMQTVLVTFSLVLVLEAIATERALILLFSFMCTIFHTSGIRHGQGDNRAHIPQFFGRLEFFRFFGAAFTHEETPLQF